MNFEFRKFQRKGIFYDHYDILNVMYHCLYIHIADKDVQNNNDNPRYANHHNTCIHGFAAVTQYELIVIKVG